jgi:hypothetical protein
MGKSPIIKAVEMLLPQRYREARTAADYGNVIADLDAQIIEATTVRDRIEDGRSTVILNGDDPAAFSRRLFEATDRVKTLRANRDEAQRKQSDAAKQEATASLEARVRKLTVSAEPAAQNALRGLHTALLDVTRHCEAYQSNVKALEAANYDAKNAGRPDLIVNVEGLRRSFVTALLGPPNDVDDIDAPPVPVRTAIHREQGESDDHYRIRNDQAWADRLAAYQRPIELRKANAATKAARDAELADPLKNAWSKAEAIAFPICVPMDIAERTRNRRRIDSIAFRNAEVGGVRKVQATDGLGKPMQLRPLNGFNGGDAA